MQINKARLPYLLIAVMTLVLASQQAVVAIAPAGHDDYLFLSQAISISKGEWLGNYYNLTHAKGPGFPIFLALNFYFGIPIIASQQCLYLFAITLLIVSIRHLTNRLTRIITFAILAFNPYFLTWLRITREPLYTIETVAIVACVIAISTHLFFHPKLFETNLGAKSTNLVYWRCGLGFFYAAFWVTREEGIWLAPVILLLLMLLLYVAAQSIVDYRKDFLKVLGRVARFVTPTALCFLVTLLPVLLLNQINYGFGGITDTKTYEFRSAYGSLTRVEDEDWHPYIPVSQETREKLYLVSPSFRELKPYIEQTVSSSSSSAGCALYQVCDDIVGGWFLWTLRDAIQQAGHFESYRELNAYLNSLTEEISQACDTQEISCRSLKRSLSPRIHVHYLERFPVHLLSGLKKLVFLKGGSQGPIDQSGSFEQSVENRTSIELVERIRQFEFFLHSRTFPVQEDQFHIRFPAGAYLLILDVYQIISPIITFGAIVQVISIVIFRRVTFLQIISLALIASVLIRMMILTLINLSLFPGFQINYLMPGTPLLYVAGILGYHELVRLWWARRCRCRESKAG